MNGADDLVYEIRAVSAIGIVLVIFFV